MAKIGFNSAASGVYSYQDALDITANNLANVNTTGFKASRASFADLIYTEKLTNDEVEYGHGNRVAKTDMMFEQSQLRNTGKETDFAALDEGFFAIETEDGVRYTKDGEFYLSREGEHFYQLCDAAGGYVLDYDGNRITVPFKGEDSTEIDDVALCNLVGIYSFENPYGLDQVGNNYFEANLSSGEAISNPDAQKKQFYTEASSTNIATEMVKMIEFQRAFQLNINMVKTNNELEGIVNNLRN